MIIFGPIPEDSGVVLKDVLSNLRSALDQAGYASASALGSTRLSQTKFVFGDTLAEARGDMARRSRDLHPDVQGLMMAFSPYKLGNELLWNLNKARNTKEHRLLIPAQAQPEPFDVRSEFTFTAELPVSMSLPAPYWDNVNNAICCPFIGDKGSVKFEAAINFCFGDVGTLAGHRAIATLYAMAGEVESIIMGFEAETARLLRERSA
jgi:hypothetical protein